RDAFMQALDEHRAWLVQQCVQMESAQVTHDATGAVTGDASGLRVLTAIELGVRSYRQADSRALQTQFQSARFALQPGDLELAQELGCSRALLQLLKGVSATPHTFQELIVSSEDDEPEAAALTLILTGLIVPHVEAPKAVAAQAAARPGAIDLQQVDDFLSSFNAPVAAPPTSPALEQALFGAEPARGAPPSRPPDDLGDTPARPVRKTPVPEVPRVARPSAAGVPLMSGTPTSQVPGMRLSQVPGMGVSLMPGMPVSQVPGMSMSQVPGMGSPQTGVPDSVYALVPREFLSAVGNASNSASRLGLYIFLSVLMLLVGVGGGGVAVWYVSHRLGAPEGKAAPVVADAEPQERAAEPATEPATEPEVAKAAPTEPTPVTKPDKRESAKTAKVPSPPRTEKPTNRPATAEPTAKPQPKPPAAGGASSEDIAFRLGLANKLLQKRDFKKAIEVCQEVLGMDPRNGQAYRTLGIAYSSLGAKAPACESYRRYLRFAPGAPDRAQIEGLLQSCQ
ncbi:MAG: tetratricopeptide repeat protein, partial [Myxococcota bacterium]